MKKNVSYVIYSLFAVFALAVTLSCSKQQTADIVNKQEEDISNYLTGHYAGSEIIRKNGASRIIIDSGHGADSLMTGDSIYFNYAGFIFSNGPSKLFTTNIQSVAEKNGFTITSTDSTFDECSTLFDSKSFIPGLINGLDGAKEGEHCVIIFSSTYGFQNKAVANVPPSSALMYEVWVNKIKKN
ncbi:MAG: FKBP-type peptidyl-prolyl cis-trans isomerase [Alistipes sp.]|nr:FKBP-type peptidyl-prolyl cis-trans isomerase [Candidatus Minthomonas equi]